MKITRSMTSILFLFATLVSGGCGGGGGGGSTGSSSDVVKPVSVSYPAGESVDTTGSAYNVTVLGTLGGDSYAVALNNQGEVVGNYLGSQGTTSAFLWKDGQMSQMAQSSQAADINDQGQAVGWLEMADGPKAFFFDNGLYQVNTQEGTSKALAVDNQGQVAGRRTTTREEAFTELDGVMTSVAPDVNGYAVAMNNVGQVVVKEVLADSFHALLVDGDLRTDLGTLGGDCTLVKGINDAGQVVGASQVAGGSYHAFVWADGRMQDLGTFGGDSSSAVAINAQGVVLVKVSRVDGDEFLLWQNGTTTAVGNLGSDYVEATDLNDQGQIVGWLMLQSGDIRAFLATPKSQG